MMTREDRQEALSLAYVHAVAVAVGMTHASPVLDYGIDLTLHEIEVRPGRHYQSGVALDVQVKSTTSAKVTPAAVTYDLAAKSYADLRATGGAPRVLVLFVLSTDETEWLRVTPHKLELRGAAYWLSLGGMRAVRNRSSVRVTIPRRQRFTPDVLRAIMQRVKAKESLS